MTNKTKHYGEKHFCQHCLQCLSNSKVTFKKGLAINHTKSVLLLEENEYINFQSFQRLEKKPFTIYCDYECTLIGSTDNISFAPNTKIYKDHIVCSCDFKLVCVDDRYSKPYKTYFGKDAIAKYLNDIVKEY